MRQFLKQGKIPTWRLFLWAFVAMGGVAYFLYPRDPRHIFWAAAIVFTGVFIVGFGLLLNWAPSSPWMRKNAYALLAFGTLANAVLVLWEVLHRK